MIEYNNMGMTPIPLSVIWVYLTGSAKWQLNRCSVALVSRLNLGSATPEHPRHPKIHQYPTHIHTLLHTEAVDKHLTVWYNGVSTK